MKLNQLAAKPQLIKILIDDKEIVKEYGEPIEFYCYDRQPMGTYLKLAQLNQKDMPEVVKTISELVLNEKGEPALNDNELLPLDITVKVIERVVSKLGNLKLPTTQDQAQK
jgi:hypothetical protein